MAEPRAEPKGHEVAAGGPQTSASDSSRDSESKSSESQEKAPAVGANDNDLEANNEQNDGENQDEPAQGAKRKRFRPAKFYKKHKLPFHILIWLIWTA